VGVWDAAFGLSMALGPVAGGGLAEAAGWRAIFWANIPVGLAAICLTGVLVPDSRAVLDIRTIPQPDRHALLGSARRPRLRGR
jgi:MFS family permease